MALLGRLQLNSVHLILSMVLLAIEASSSKSSDDLPQAKPGCPSQCGNLTIPYPFGIGDDCYLREGFQITCDESVQPPRAILLANSSIIATSISLYEGELRILNTIGHDCYDNQGNQNDTTMRYSPSLRLNPPFTISAKNKFIDVGCDTSALFQANFLHCQEDSKYILACMNACYDLTAAANGSCYPGSIGCCQTLVPAGLQNFTLTLGSFLEYKDVEWDFKRCSYSFIVEEGEFIFLPETSLQELSMTKKLPMILDWELQDRSCAEAQKKQDDYVCKGVSKCVNRNINFLLNRLVTIASSRLVSQGIRISQFHMVAEMLMSHECMAPTNPCHHGECMNLVESYKCLCREGYRNKDPQTCIPINPTPKKTFLKKPLNVSALVIAVLVAATIGIYREMYERSKRKVRYET